MLSDNSKTTVAGIIFRDCLNQFSQLSGKYISLEESRFSTFEDFISWTKTEYNYFIEKCKFVFESFPILHDHPSYSEMYDRLFEWTPEQIFQLYGQPVALPNYFFFEQFRFQTKEEADRSNKIALEILNEILEDEY